MFFDSVEQIPEIMQKVRCAVFVMPKIIDIPIKDAIYLRPNSKNTITIDAMREFITLADKKQKTERFLVISPADKMNISAQNAFLKTLEEPREHIHFILLTQKYSELFPTILSRSQVFWLERKNYLDAEVVTEKKTKELARELIVATPKALVAKANAIAKKKEARAETMAAAEVAIEILYKSYFKTGDKKLLVKLAKFINLYNNIKRNGQIKLHLVADLC